MFFENLLPLTIHDTKRSGFGIHFICSCVRRAFVSDCRKPKSKVLGWPHAAYTQQQFLVSRATGSKVEKGTRA
jgi:hypothetical protein